MKSERIPTDRRSRAVIGNMKIGAGIMLLRLECGHEARRKTMCSLTRMICRQCA